MRIALVAPSSVPFTVGGAEKLWWGLTTHVNRHTPHAMELIKLPSPERNLWEIAASYRAFAALVLDDFDMVVSTKYPAWMVAHRHHVVYLQHRLRGLYDTYPARLPLAPAKLPPAVAPLWRLLERPGLDRAALPELFGRLDELRTGGAVAADERERLVALPGPFARAVVHALDRVGLAPGAVRRYLAISRTVAVRDDYFPPGVDVEVVPHPSDLDGLHGGAGEFVFTASRLEAPKRIELLVRAYRKCRTDVPLVVAGEGPDGEALRALAGDDARIRFVGRLADDALVDHYARAHFVVFVPRAEDMGLITIEAMKSGKPVLTVDDAGGVTEFVRDGVNGRIVPPDADSLAGAIDALLADRDRLRAMGEAARATGDEVTWRRTADALLREAAADAPRGEGGAAPPAAGTHGAAPASRRRLLVLNSYGVFPPDAGGKKRIFYLYQALASRTDVTLLNLGPAFGAPEVREFGPHFREIRVPPDERFLAAEAALQRRLQRPVTDIAALLHAHDVPALVAAMRRLAPATDVVIASHLYMTGLISRHWPGEVWYDAHNVESDMKADILGVPRLAAPFDENGAGTAAGGAGDVVAEVARAERTLVLRASRVLAASRFDATRLAALYGRDEATIEYAPNGVTVPDDPWLEPARRGALKSALGFGDRPVALFVGSDHGPNHDAADLVVAAARACPGWTFWIAGSICGYKGLRDAPANVFALGLLSEPELLAVLRAADAGLNPMLRGSGTNLKMLDYAAHGALVLSTETGARGLGFVAGRDFVLFAPDRLAPTLAELAGEVPSPRTGMRTAARALVEAHYSWEAVAAQFVRPAPVA